MECVVVVGRKPRTREQAAYETTLYDEMHNNTHDTWELFLLLCPFYITCEFKCFICEIVNLQ